MATTSLRILVVDDDRDTADSLAMLLKLDGHAAEPAYDARSALRLARQHSPSLVFLDLAMPEVNGFRLAQWLWTLPGMEAAVLVCITGYAGPEYRKRAHEVGCTHFLVKPVAPEDLLRLAGDVTEARRITW